MSARAKKKQQTRYAKLCEETVSPLMLEPWTPFERGYIPEALDVEVYVNSRYQVQIKPHFTPWGACVWLSIKLLDKSAGRDWRDFQRIKNELVGEEVEAVELYPAESRLVDGANQYHVYCFPEIGRFPFGFTSRLVNDGDDQRSTADGKKFSRQRSFEQEPKSRQIVVHLDNNPQNNNLANVKVVDQGGPEDLVLRAKQR